MSVKSFGIALKNKKTIKINKNVIVNVYAKYIAIYCKIYAWVRWFKLYMLPVETSPVHSS